MKKKGIFWKVVFVIVFLEILVGSLIFGYKKLVLEKKDTLSKEDPIVTSLYEKVAYYDSEIVDVFSQEAILYYSYHNLQKSETINCDVVEFDKETYSCDGVTDFISYDQLLKEAKKIYGEDITFTMTSFMIDQNHYGLYDEENDGIVVLTKQEKEDVDPVNSSIKEVEKKEDGSICLTVEVKDGIVGTLKATYRYIFVKEGSKYYLNKIEKLTK